jgi:hypothetical protein
MQAGADSSAFCYQGFSFIVFARTGAPTSGGGPAGTHSRNSLIGDRNVVNLAFPFQGFGRCE